MSVTKHLPKQIRRPIGVLYRTAGRLTSSARVRPSFAVVGAQRAGTTSLHRALVQHPDLVQPLHRKGLRYFDINYKRGDAWYQGHFPLRGAVQRRRDGAGEAIAFESTPYYMFHPAAIGRMAEDLPGVRVVAMLRDPVERAYSAYAHELARGFETEPFERALELEPERLAGEEERLLAEPGYVSRRHQHNAYLGRGEYVDQLERIERTLGRDRMLVVDSAAFFADPATEYAGVVEFLGLPAWPEVRHEQHNARPRTTMSPGLRARLEAHFEPYDERLATWLGEVPSWRR